MMASRLPLLLVLLAVAGCSPDASSRYSEGGEALKPYAIEGWYQDYFTPTFELCGEPTEYEPYEKRTYDSYNEPRPAALVSEECQDALLTDLKIDWEELGELSHDGWVFYHATWATVYALLAWPMGTVDDLRWFEDGAGAAELLEMLSFYDHSKSPPFLREPLIEELENLSRTTGEQRVNALLYNMVMSSVLRTSFILPEDAPDDGYVYAMTNLNTRTLYIGSMIAFGGSVQGTTFLVHEATHLWLNQRHVACPDLVWPRGAEGMYSCDSTWEGPWGYQVGTAWLMALHRDWDLDEPDDWWLWYGVGFPIERCPYLILEP